MKTIWSGGTPRRLDQLRDHTFTVNQTYESKEDVKLALCEFGEVHNRRHTVKNLNGFGFQGRDTDTLFRVRCVESSCPFQLEASKQNGLWSIRIFTSHCCQPRNWTKREGRTAYQARMLIGLIKPRIAMGLPLNSKEITAAIRPYLNLEPSNTFVDRVRALAMKQYVGDQINVLQALPRFMNKLRNCGHSAEMDTINSERMAQIALRVEKDLYEQRLKMFKEDETPPAFDEEGVMTEINKRIQPNASYVYALKYSPNVAKIMFPRLVPVFSADACHCSGPTKGTMFGMYGRDVNFRQVTLGVMFVSDNESHETWENFLSFIKKAITDNWSDKVVTTDQDKGADTAVQEHLNGAKHFFCSYHRKKYLKECRQGDIGSFR